MSLVEPNSGPVEFQVADRLARLETKVDNLGATIGELKEALEKANDRTWRLIVAIALLATGGGAGGITLVRAVLGV